MVRGRSLGPQWLRGKGVTPVVSSDGLKKMKESGSLLNLLKFLKVSDKFLKVSNKFLKVSNKFLKVSNKFPKVSDKFPKFLKVSDKFL